MATIKYCLINSISLVGRVVTYQRPSCEVVHAVVLDETTSGYLLENGDYVRANLIMNVGVD